MTSLLVVAACGTEPVTVTFDEATDSLARFIVVNRSERDVQAIRFELSFRSQAGDVVRVDTVAYTTTTDAATGNPTAFVRAGYETFFMTKGPSNSVSATATVLDLTYIDGTKWPETSQ
jgi:hypothetical protein